jgi:hypothetical protein
MTPDLFASDSAHWLVPSPVAPRRRIPQRTDRPAALTVHQRIGMALGRDHARFGVALPLPFCRDANPLQQGWQAGVASQSERQPEASVAVRRWLQLRLQAWQQGVHFELLHITSTYLRQLEVPVCPITRLPLGQGTEPDQAAIVSRLRCDAGYAAGHLAMLSQRAHVAKGSHRFDAVAAIARELDEAAAQNQPAEARLGLDAAAWSRLAVLCSFVEPLAHDQACELPLLVLPPNRLRLFNPAQALQAFISRQLLSAGWSQRINAFEALLTGLPVRRAFRSFFQTLLPRVLEAGQSADLLEVRWAIEDAWRHEAVRQRWSRFARLLDADGCTALLKRASAQGLTPGMRLEHQADAEAVDGWCLASGGQTPLPSAPAAELTRELLLH